MIPDSPKMIREDSPDLGASIAENNESTIKTDETGTIKGKSFTFGGKDEDVKE